MRKEAAVVLEDGRQVTSLPLGPWQQCICQFFVRLMQIYLINNGVSFSV
jgi:hypothetical protein